MLQILFNFEDMCSTVGDGAGEPPTTQRLIYSDLMASKDLTVCQLKKVILEKTAIFRLDLKCHNQLRLQLLNINTNRREKFLKMEQETLRLKSGTHYFSDAFSRPRNFVFLTSL